MDQREENPIARAEYFHMPSSAFLELMRDVLAKGVPFRFKASGSSMTPFIRDEDVITVVPLDKRGAGLGTIVAFKHPDSGRLFIHRIVGVSPGKFLIAGDNNAQFPDGWIPVDHVIGCVSQINRNGQNVYLGIGPERYLLAFLSRKNWLTSLRSFVAYIRGRN